MHRNLFCTIHPRVSTNSRQLPHSVIVPSSTLLARLYMPTMSYHLISFHSDLTPMSITVYSVALVRITIDKETCPPSRNNQGIVLTTRRMFRFSSASQQGSFTTSIFTHLRPILGRCTSSPRTFPSLSTPSSEQANTLSKPHMTGTARLSASPQGHSRTSKPKHGTISTATKRTEVAKPISPKIRTFTMT